MPPIASTQEFFEHLPSYFVPESAIGVRAKVQFELSGEGGGEWGVTIADGMVQVRPGRIESPALTVRVSAADWLAIVNRKMNPMAAFMQGRLKVVGPQSLALKLQSLFRAPGGE